MIGTLDSYPNFPSQNVQSRQVDVWRPGGSTADQESLSVLYMHDGQNLFYPDLSIARVDWGIDETLSKLIAAGQVRPTMVVGIWNTDQRRAEYLPQSPFNTITGRRTLEALYWALDGEKPRRELYEGGPISDAYLRFLVQELKPFIDGRYHTRPEREETFVMGSSMGGLISLYGVLQHPEIFTGAACLSTHWPPVANIIEEFLATKLPPPGRHRFYFDYGTATLDSLYEPHQQRVDRLLANSGYTAGQDWVTYRFEGAEHSEVAWRDRLDTPLKFLLAQP